MAKNLKDLRLEAGLTLQQLADAIDAPVSGPGAWERGDYGPHPNRYPKLAQALKVTTEAVRLAVEATAAEKHAAAKEAAAAGK